MNSSRGLYKEKNCRDHRPTVQHSGAAADGQYGWSYRRLSAALADIPSPVFGDGTQSRSFTYVGDVVAR